MAGKAEWQYEIKTNVKKVIEEVEDLRRKVDDIENSDHKIQLDIDTKKLDSVLSNLDKMLSSIGKGTGDFKELENLSKYLENIIVEVQSLKKVFESTFSKGFDTTTSAKEIEKLTNKIKELENELSKIKNGSSIQKDIFDGKSLTRIESDLKKFQSRFEKLDIKKPVDSDRLPEYSNALNNINTKIKEYEILVDSLKTKDIIDEDDIGKIEKLSDEIKSTFLNASKFSASQKGSSSEARWKEIDKISKYLEKNTKISKEAKQYLEDYIKLLKSDIPVDVAEIHKEFIKISEAERVAGREGKKFIDILSDKTLYGFATQLAGYFLSFSDILRYFKYGIDAVYEYDDALTKVSYTMDLSKNKLDSLGGSVLDMASDMKSSVESAMQAAQIYANMNTTAKEIQKLSEPTLILSNLTGFDITETANQIQAVTQQFDLAEKEYMHIADVYDHISKNISVDYSKGIQGMAEAVQVAGSTAKQAGLDFEQLTAIVAKAQEKTRLEGSQIGNGIKTIMTRLSKVGSLTGEVDNETLSQASESLHKIGVEVYNLDGSYRKFDVIMGELATKWNDLTDAEKSNISFAIAATRQTNLLSAILGNFAESMKLAEEASNSSGNAIENHEKYLDSFGAHMQSLGTESKIAWINILDSDVLKTGIDLITELVKATGNLVDTVGLIPTIAGTAGLVKFIKSFA